MISHRNILIVAYAGQGLINPALRFANRLLKKGVHVTFSTSLSVVRRIKNEITPLDHGLTLAPFSDGHDNGKQASTSLQQFVSDFSTYGSSAVAEIITSAAAAGQPFDHLVYTIAVPWAARVANAHSIKSTILWCQSATVMDIYYYYFNDQYHDPLNLPGLPPLTTHDLPSYILPSTPKEHEFILSSIYKHHISDLKTTPRILVNTFNELEHESIIAIKNIDFLPVGPLIPSQSRSRSQSQSQSESSDKTKNIKNYINWMNTKPKSSVVYVSFGTIATFTIHQLEEIGAGLLLSGRPFLWVIRDMSELAGGRLSCMIDELKKQGMIIDWCDQMVVLSHPAIGCFVMHGGWNSTVETLVAGVPTVVFPQWSDQGTNAKMMEDVWRTGVRVRKREPDGVVEGKEIQRCVAIVMEDENIKRNAHKWKELATEALSDGGSSDINLRAFLDDI